MLDSGANILFSFCGLVPMILSTFVILLLYYLHILVCNYLFMIIYCTKSNIKCV